MPCKDTRILFLPILMLLLYINYRAFLYNEHVSEKERSMKITITKDTKYLLFWSLYFQQRQYCIGYGSEPFKNCEYNNCITTDNRALIPLEQFDALMFFHTWLDHDGNPWIRLPHQMYIYVNTEAPTKFEANLKSFDSFFNWTMTYRLDSNIIRSYGHVVNGGTNYSTPSREFVKNKTRIAAWFVSHCPTNSKREELNEKIQNYLSVDVYGGCGKLKCPKEEGTYVSSDECYDMIEKKYKFYFSFENSYCLDYVTEKLYYILRRNIVPVVYGGADYKIIAPPHSVINVADFESVKELTDYLKYLDENPDEYLKYFKWKKMYTIVDWKEPAACHICKKLNEPIPTSVYYNLYEWWRGENNNMCKTGNDLPKIVIN